VICTSCKFFIQSFPGLRRHGAACRGHQVAAEPDAVHAEPAHHLLLRVRSQQVDPGPTRYMYNIKKEFQMFEQHMYIDSNFIKSYLKNA
jgi:hypothetical protein